MKHLFSILNGYAFSTDLFISEGIQVLKISSLYQNQLYMCPSGTKQANLSNDDILTQHIAIPDKVEQNKIANYLNESIEKFNNAIAKAQKEIAAIKEYREALITDLVTGRRQVP